MAEGFDKLYQTGVQEIQVGILKRLRGTPITTLTDQYGMRYSPAPPYSLLASDSISFVDMQRLARFAKYWDLVANSGRYPASLQLLLTGHSFERFIAFSDWCHDRKLNTFGVKPNTMMDSLYSAMKQQDLAAESDITRAIRSDALLYNGPVPHCLSKNSATRQSGKSLPKRDFSSRQQRHQHV